MSARRVSLALLLLFSLAWAIFSFQALMGSILGDCFDNERCWGVKEYAPAAALWRWLAVQLAAILAFFFIRKR